MKRIGTIILLIFTVVILTGTALAEEPEPTPPPVTVETTPVPVETTPRPVETTPTTTSTEAPATTTPEPTNPPTQPPPPVCADCGYEPCECPAVIAPPPTNPPTQRTAAIETPPPRVTSPKVTTTSFETASTGADVSDYTTISDNGNDGNDVDSTRGGKGLFIFLTILLAGAAIAVPFVMKAVKLNRIYKY